MKRARSTSCSRSQAPLGLGDPAVPGTSFWRKALILGAALSLAISLITRYSTVQLPEAHATKTAASQSLDAQRQHLLNDGANWSAPAATFVLLEAQGAFARVPSSIPRTVRLYSENCLYNRPPPSC